MCLTSLLTCAVLDDGLDELIHSTIYSNGSIYPLRPAYLEWLLEIWAAVKMFDIVMVNQVDKNIQS